VTRTLQSVLEDVRDALGRAALTDLDWVRAEVVAARRTRTGLVVGELGWRSRRVRFACVNRSLNYRLTQQGSSWQPGLEATFALRVVLHPRFGFQVEVHDVDIGSIRDGGRGDL
jgi:hypothetical protein